jgi:hypothetical protein
MSRIETIYFVWRLISMRSRVHDYIIVWSAMSGNWIIGHIFFDDAINSEYLCAVILFTFIGHLNENGCGYVQ